jgi:photosystem II oxygen-evolving enhancer protein 2
MLKRIAVVLLIVLSLSFTGCTTAVSGLKNYVDSTDGYEFFYPNGWLPVKVSSGPDIVFHDLIELTENVSVVISPVPQGKTLADLGTPGEVGYKLAKSAMPAASEAIAPPDSGRKAELVNAGMRESGGKTYYILEYTVKANQQLRHDLATVAVSRGKLFTFNASTPERRWPKVQKTFERVINSFLVY